MKAKSCCFIFLLLTPWVGLFSPQKEVSPQSISGRGENANFKLLLNETEIGTIQYTLTDDGTYTRTCKISFAGRSLNLDLEIHSNRNGIWETISIKRDGEVLSVEREGNEAIVHGKNDRTAIKLLNGHIIWDQVGPAFESFMLKRYDSKRRGKQRFSRLFIPFNMERLVPPTDMEVELEFMSQEKTSIGGRETVFDCYEARSPVSTLKLWSDKNAKLYMIHNPAEHAALIREGYEELAFIGSKEPFLSRPIFEVKKKTVMIPMRDGVKLATDIYFPQGTQERWPTILRRTPYDKKTEEIEAKYYARRGYVVAVQDCRGLFESDGIFEPFIVEPKDGYDTVEWLGTRDWSSGKVGMMGLSYQGWVQLWTASQKPPHLTTIVPSCSPADPFYDNPYLNGIFMPPTIDLVQIFAAAAAGTLSDETMHKILYKRHDQALNSLPVIDFDKKLLGKEIPYWRRWIEHSSNDDYWKQANFLATLKELDLPVFLQTGWFDLGVNGTRLVYEGLKQSKNKFIKLIIGPWGHVDKSSSKWDEYDFGPEAAVDLQVLFLRWFDYWLKGKNNKILEEPLIQLFSMFSNRWLKGNTYPLPSTNFRKVFLSSSRGANTSQGDGKLIFSVSDAGKEVDQYVYDPGDPTPYPDYYVPSEKQSGQEMATSGDAEALHEKKSAYHKRITDSRNDILVFQTEPLRQPLTVVGPLSVILYASSSAIDTDWIISLMDADENGRILHLTLGGIRARYRNSLEKPELLETNKIYEYKLDLGQTGMTFRKGHRIRIEVASAFFPLFSRNLNTGGQNEKDTAYKRATQRIYHSAKYPSCILLPVIDTGN